VRLEPALTDVGIKVPTAWSWLEYEHEAVHLMSFGRHPRSCQYTQRDGIDAGNGVTRTSVPCGKGALGQRCPRAGRGGTFRFFWSWRRGKPWEWLQSAGSPLAHPAIGLRSFSNENGARPVWAGLERAERWRVGNHCGFKRSI
jgi:hypothetical protein